MERLSQFDAYRNVEVKGAIGRIIFKSMPMPLEVAQEIWGDGQSVPLDIVPSEFWREPGAEFPRFSEENLGRDF